MRSVAAVVLRLLYPAFLTTTVLLALGIVGAHPSEAPGLFPYFMQVEDETQGVVSLRHCQNYCKTASILASRLLS
ncbi:hypothetical protein LUU34_00035600 [Aix galericulata]|nr:hypothetical protein LUU34_00035600 [Aix galericulata]